MATVFGFDRRTSAIGIAGFERSFVGVGDLLKIS